MHSRKAIWTVSGLVLILLAMFVPAAAILGPAASPIGTVGARAPPASAVDALPTWEGRAFYVRFVSNGTAGESGVFWTELWYSRNEGPWVQYMPPWNPSGEWPGIPVNNPNPQNITIGSVFFDTSLTGGDARYNFTTVAVDRGFMREPGPPQDSHASPKAKTTVDSIPPNVFIAKPSAGAWTNVNTLTWLAEDATSGVASVNVSVDGGAVHHSIEAAGSLDMGLTAQGDHTAVITATDRAGNANTVVDPFHYDPNAPTLAIASPAPNSYAKSGSVDVTWTVDETGAGLASLQLRVDAAAPVSLPLNATSYDVTGLAESGHVVTLTAVDNASNMASESVPFGVDATPPTVYLVSPADGVYLSATQLQAAWAATDAGSGIAQYKVSLDGGAPQTVTNAAHFTFGDVAEGAHTVLVQAFDRAGNMAQVSARVTLDVTPPTVDITSPAQGADVPGNVSVNWSASDSGSGLGQVFVIVDGTNSLGVPSTAVAHNVALSQYGIHTVTVRVYDKAGNMAEATVAFSYAAPVPPSSSSLPSLDFWIIMAIIGAIAVGSAYYAVRRRKKAQG